VTGWHEGPLVGFDLETTSANPEAARIVTAAVPWRGTPEDGDAAWLMNPGIEIPAEAVKIHGITTERAQTEGAEPALAIREICTRLEIGISRGWPLVIFNAPYDTTVLDRECRRYGLPPFGDLLSGVSCVIDPFVLDKSADPYRRGKRTLTAACGHYGVTLDGAHEAGADAIAAMRVAWKIARAYPDIATTPLGDLHELQVKAKAEQAASFQDYLRKQGNDEVVDGSWPFRAYEGTA